jgi:proline iminopeptidase
MPPIPPAAADGATRTTPLPLSWRADGPEGAPPLLLLHGGPGAHHDYLYPQALALADRWRLITYDQRGGGRSRTDDPAPVTWRVQVDDLAAVCRELCPVPPVLVGYSWGALLAMLYALEGRQRPLPAVRALVLLSPAPIARGWRAEFEGALAARGRAPAVVALREALAASGLRDTDPAAYRQRTFELSVAGYFADPQRARDLTPFRVTAKVQQAVWESLGDYDLRPALAQLGATPGAPPALVVHGREDPIPLASAEAAATALRARLVVLDGCGHVPYVEAPTPLWAAVRAFLDDPAGGGPR